MTNKNIELSNDHVEYVVEDIHYGEEILRRIWILVPIIIGLAVWVAVK